MKQKHIHPTNRSIPFLGLVSLSLESDPLPRGLSCPIASVTSFKSRGFPSLCLCFAPCRGLRDNAHCLLLDLKKTKKDLMYGVRVVYYTTLRDRIYIIMFYFDDPL